MRAMIPTATILLCLCPIGLAAEQSRTKDTIPLEKQFRHLVQKRDVTAAFAGLRHLDGEVAALAEKHGKPKVISILRDMAREPGYGPHACEFLASLTPPEEHLAFLKKVKVKMSRDADIRDISRQIARAKYAANHARAMSLANKRWGFPEDGKKKYGSLWDGKSLVRRLYRLDSPLLTRFLPNAAVYRVRVYNPYSAKTGRELFPYALIVQDGKPVYVEDDKAAAEFITALKLKIADKRIAKDVVLLFALLRDYELQEKQRIDKRNRAKSKPEDWKLTIKRDGEAWVITCPFMYDPVLSACGQWKVTVNQNGEIAATLVKQIFAIGGYK